MNPNDFKVLSLVLGVERLEIGQGRLAVVAAKGPELHDHNPSSEILQGVDVGLEPAVEIAQRLRKAEVGQRVLGGCVAHGWFCHGWLGREIGGLRR